MNLKIARVFIFEFVMYTLWFHLPAQSKQQKKGQEDEIREAIIRYQIANWELFAEAYFIEIQSKDPSKDFLAKFADMSKPVKEKSASRIRKKDAGDFHVEDRRTRKRGVIFNQESINWKSDSEVEVEGGYSCASLCAAGGIFYLSRQNGKWSVMKYGITIQS
jgi:hypothetical protein